MINVTKTGHYKSTISDNALDILKKRYFIKDDNGEPTETFDGMCKRVAKCIAKVHSDVYHEDYETTKSYMKKYYKMMNNLDFLPNTPTLLNAGRNNKQSLSACFVCPIENNVYEILRTVQNTVLIHKSGGGTGFNFSSVNKPKNDFNKHNFTFIFKLDKSHKDYEDFKNTNFKYAKKYNDSYILEKPYVEKVIFDNLKDIFNFKNTYRLLSNMSYTPSSLTYNIIIDFSKIRAEGSLISTSKGEASGPVSFMKAWDNFIEFISNDITPITTIKLFDSCTNAVKQGGVRRGANMGILNADNPHIKEFIHCKENEYAITNFNLSVGVIDKDIFDNKELFDEIVDCAWKNGEPGLIFLDRINEKNNIMNHKIEATNPCFTGDMRLLTEDGYKTFEELTDTEPFIINEDAIIIKGKVWCSGEKEVIKLTFDNGKVIKCTPNHIFKTIDDEKIEAKDLKDSGKQILTYTHNIIDRNGCPRCIDMEVIGIEKVYDFEEPNTHWGVVEDFIVHNCGEQPLLPYESCNLGSINLSNMVKYDVELKTAEFDWNKYINTIHDAVDFLDDVIDANNYPIPEIEKASKKYRKIGLGVMGFADVLCMLQYPYDSKKAKDFARKLAKTLKLEAEVRSSLRFFKYGVCPGFEDIKDSQHKRNASLTTIAPTGSISTICGCSSGIEPIFSVVYTRHTLNFEKDMYVVHPIFKDMIEDKYPKTNDLIIEEASVSGSIMNNSIITDQSFKDFFKSAGDISYKDHIDMQSIWQEYIDSSISKTINMSESATREDIADAYHQAYASGCKGITVYRDKSREKQVLETGSTTKTSTVESDNSLTVSLNDLKDNTIPITYQETIDPIIMSINTNIGEKVNGNINIENIRVRGDSLRGYTERIKIGCGELYVTVNFDDKGIREIFATNGKSGGCHSQSEATCRMISTALKYNIPTDVIIKQLKGIRCPSAIKNSSGSSLSCPDAIARCMEKCIKKEETKKNEIKNDDISNWYKQQIVDYQKRKKDCKDYINQLNYSYEDLNRDVYDNLSSFTSYAIKNDGHNYNIEMTDNNIDKSKCPECGSPLEFEGGCQVCRSCGYSKCH